MLKQTYRNIFLTIALSTISYNTQAGINQCVPIGGTALGDAIDETHFVAALSGSLAAANAQVTNQKKTDTGLILDMEHTFISIKGGQLKTKDQAVLTIVPDKVQVYMAEIIYNVVESKGEFAGYTGKFNSFGIINLSEGKVVVRYSGEVCK